jgi:hypothetical protein
MNFQHSSRAVCWSAFSNDSNSSCCPECVRTLAIEGFLPDTLRPEKTAEPAAAIRSTAEAEAGAEPPLPPNPPGLELIRRLGAGGMGVVYLATDVQTGRLVSVKVLHAAGDPAACDRFGVEVRALAELNHPHIVTVFAAYLTSHFPYYTMEFVLGGTLARHVALSGQLDSRTAALLMGTVARAAHAAHERGIVHRDIKPGNVLLSGQAEPGASTALVPKLADFGLAKRTDRNDGLTLGGGTIGTPAFMAPEQASGGAVTERTDVYGLGATLYYALTGAAPFEGADVRSLLTRVESIEPARVRRLRPSVPLDLEAIVHKCLEKNPADRYASAAELADDLAHFASGGAVAARPRTLLTRFRKTLRRRRRQFLGVALAATLLLGVFALGAVRGNPGTLGDDQVLKQMQKDLTAKKNLELVGATGTPLWHNWALDPCGFTPNPKKDKACSFLTFEKSFVDLCPDPMTDHYRVSAELCQMDVQYPGFPEGGVYMVGLYFGRQRVANDTGEWAQRLMSVGFTEAPLQLAGRAHLASFMYYKSPQLNFIGSMDLGHHDHAFKPAKALPGKWHTIVVEVTPEEVKFWFDKTDNSPPAAIVPIERVHRDQRLHHDLAVFKTNSTLQMPNWSPRGALGVWAHSSLVAFRNVTLTPID